MSYQKRVARAFPAPVGVDFGVQYWVSSGGDIIGTVFRGLAGDGLPLFVGVRDATLMTRLDASATIQVRKAVLDALPHKPEVSTIP